MALRNSENVKFENLLNFRDVGKSINQISGLQLLREDLLYRSARPDYATASDRHQLTSIYKIKTIIDLRTPTEQLLQAQKYPSSTNITSSSSSSSTIPQTSQSSITTTKINLNGQPYTTALLFRLPYLQILIFLILYLLNFRQKALTLLSTHVIAPRGLHGLATDTLTHSRAEIARIFTILCDKDAYPVLLHCTQGKDRTGLIVLLVLRLCGVGVEGVKRDYLLSQRELERERERKLEEIRWIGLPDSFADCSPSWVEEVCGFVDEKYGGVEKFLLGCGVRRKRLGVLVEMLTGTEMEDVQVR